MNDRHDELVRRAAELKAVSEELAGRLAESRQAEPGAVDPLGKQESAAGTGGDSSADSRSAARGRASRTRMKP
jgi:hypothetical protein